MRIESARVRNYRCVRDSGSFDVEPDKTILVGINEAGKTAILRGLQQVSRPQDVPPIDWLYDAPASQVDDIRRERLEQSALAVATVVMAPEAEDLAGLTLPDDAEDIRLVVTSYMDGKRVYGVAGLPTRPSVGDLDKTLLRLTSAMGKQSDREAKSMAERLVRWKADHVHEALEDSAYTELRTLLNEALPLFDEGSAAEKHWETLDGVLKSTASLDKISEHLFDRMPPFV